jgi:hypothetical protein
MKPEPTYFDMLLLMCVYLMCEILHAFIIQHTPTLEPNKNAPRRLDMYI